MPQDDEPIVDLAELEQDVSPQFFSAVRKKINRRVTANQLAGFSWNLPGAVLKEFALLVTHFLSSGQNDRTRQ